MLTRDVSPEELRELVEKMRAKDPDNVAVWLDGECQLEAALRKEAFAVEDKVKANRHDERCNRFGAATLELLRLRERMEAFTEVLGNRIIVALKEAREPSWQPTHRHYKGTLYRVTGRRFNAEGEELIDGVDYDDAAGRRYWLPLSRWESTLESGKLRYRPLTAELQ